MTNAERRRRYYADNKEKHAALVKKGRRRAYELVRAAKDKPCADCGIKYPYWVMDLDHRDPDMKEEGLGRLINSRGWRGARLQAEIDKCDVVCANCHRLRHPPEDFAAGGCVRTVK